MHVTPKDQRKITSLQHHDVAQCISGLVFSQDLTRFNTIKRIPGHHLRVLPALLYKSNNLSVYCTALSVGCCMRT